MIDSPVGTFGKEKFLNISPIQSRNVALDNLNLSKDRFLTAHRKLSFNSDKNNLEDKNNNLIHHLKVSTPLANSTPVANSTPKFNNDSPPYKKMKELSFDSSTPCNGQITPPYSDISLIASVTQSPKPHLYGHVTSTAAISRLSFTAPVNPFTSDGRIAIASDHTRKRKQKGNSFHSYGHCSTSDKSILGPSFHELESSRFTEQFKIDEFVASGSFGTVYKCTNFIDGIPYAIKKSSKPVAGTNYEQLSRREVFALSALANSVNSGHIVKYFSCWIEMGHLYIQTEYCDGGSLEKQIENNRIYTEMEAVRLMNHVAKGLKCMHLENLAHLDIKPANILICKVNHLDSSDEEFFKGSNVYDPVIYKIGDFGNATIVDEPFDVQDGDCRYMAKELLNENYNNLKKADIFSFGMTLFELVDGRPLPKNGDEWHKLRNGKIPYISKYSRSFNNAIKYMLHPEPEKRPDVNTVLRLSRMTRACMNRDFTFKHTDCYKKTRSAQKRLQNLSFPFIAENSQSTPIPEIVVDHLL